MADITKSIIDLKNKLTNLELTHEKKFKDLEKRKENQKSLESKLNELVLIQKDSIFYNVGGKKCFTSKGLILNSIYKSILKEVLSNLEKMGKPITDAGKIFIDRNPEYFPYIVEILRKSFQAYEKAQYDVSKIFDLELVVETSSIDGFYEEVKFYFKDDSEMVFDHFKIVDSEGNSPATKIGGLLVKEVKVSTNFPSDQLNPYRAKTFKDISKKNSKKGYFISYDSNIIFELENEMNISSIEIKPFSSNLDYWIPCEGSGAFIFTSLNGQDGETNWEFCTSLPDDYGLEWENDKTTQLYFDKRRAKYVKIVTGDYTLSVSYINFS